MKYRKFDVILLHNKTSAYLLIIWNSHLEHTLSCWKHWIQSWHNYWHQKNNPSLIYKARLSLRKDIYESPNLLFVSNCDTQQLGKGKDGEVYSNFGFQNKSGS